MSCCACNGACAEKEKYVLSDDSINSIRVRTVSAKLRMSDLAGSFLAR